MYLLDSVISEPFPSPQQGRKDRLRYGGVSISYLGLDGTNDEPEKMVTDGDEMAAEFKFEKQFTAVHLQKQKLPEAKPDDDDYDYLNEPEKWADQDTDNESNASEIDRETKRQKLSMSVQALALKKLNLDDQAGDQERTEREVRNNVLTARFGAVPAKDGYLSIGGIEKFKTFYIQLGEHTFRSHPSTNSTASLDFDHGKQAQAAIYIAEKVAQDSNSDIREKNVHTPQTRFGITLPAGFISANGPRGKAVSPQTAFQDNYYVYKTPAQLIQLAQGRSEDDPGYPWPPAFVTEVKNYILSRRLAKVVGVVKKGFKFVSLENGQVRIQKSGSDTTQLEALAVFQSAVDDHKNADAHPMGSVHSLEFKVDGLLDTDNWSSYDFNKITGSTDKKFTETTKSNLNAMANFIFDDERSNKTVKIFWTSPDVPYYPEQMANYTKDSLDFLLWAFREQQPPLAPYLKNGKLDISAIPSPWVARPAISRFFNPLHYSITMGLAALREYQSIGQVEAILRSASLKVSFIRVSGAHAAPVSEDIGMADNGASAPASSGKSKSKTDFYRAYIEYPPDTRIKMRGLKLADGQDYTLSFGNEWDQYPTRLQMTGRVTPIVFEGPIWEGRNKRKIDAFLVCQISKKSPIKPVCVDTLERVLDPTGPQMRVQLDEKANQKSMKAHQKALNNLGDKSMSRKADVLIRNLNANLPSLQITEEQMCFPFNARSEKAETWKMELQKFNEDATWNLNEKQIETILKRLDHKIFNLVQGPPGTGKTKTICGLTLATLCADSMRTICKEVKKARKIIICAPSNGVVDLIVDATCAMLPKSNTALFNPIILRHHVPGAESRFAHMSNDEVEQYFESANQDDITQEVARMTSHEGYSDPNIIEAVHRSLAQGRSRFHRLIKQSTSRQMITAAERNEKELRAQEDAGQVLGREQRHRLAMCTRFNELGAMWQNNATTDAEKAPLWAEWLKVQAFVRRMVLSQADIIVTTTVNSSQEELVSSFKPDLLIIDETAQGFEPETILPICLFETVKQIFLFGDHEQLGPTVTNTVTNEVENQAKLDLFTRLIGLGMEVTLLDTQYRMNPNICEVVSVNIYNGKLKNGPNVLERNPENNNLINAWRLWQKSWRIKYNGESGLQTKHLSQISDVIFIDTSAHAASSGYSDKDTFSRINFVEAKLIAHYVIGLCLMKPVITPDMITIMVTYKAQIDLIRKKFNDIGRTIFDQEAYCKIVEDRSGCNGQNLSTQQLVDLSPDWTKIKYSTVENMLGGESPFVVLSLVSAGKDVSSKSQSGSAMPLTSFMKNYNRLNVALSRAQYGMAVVGQQDGLRKHGGKNSKIVKIMDFLINKGWLITPPSNALFLSRHAVELLKDSNAQRHRHTTAKNLATGLVDQTWGRDFDDRPPNSGRNKRSHP